MRAWLVGAAVAGAVVLVGCGGSPQPAPEAAAKTPALVVTPTTPAAAPAATAPTVNYGKQYEAIVAPTNTAIDTWSTKIQALPDNATDATIQAIDTPVGKAIGTMNGQLLHITWPGQAETDVRTLTSADGAVLGDLTILGGANALNATADIGQLVKDMQVVSVDANAVRADLGLPASS